MKNNKLPLIEVTRWDIIRRSQRESPERFQKQKFYKAKDFNGVNFEELFTNDTLHGNLVLVITSLLFRLRGLSLAYILRLVAGLV